MVLVFAPVVHHYPKFQKFFESRLPRTAIVFESTTKFLFKGVSMTLILKADEEIVLSVDQTDIYGNSLKLNVHWFISDESLAVIKPDSTTSGEKATLSASGLGRLGSFTVTAKTGGTTVDLPVEIIPADLYKATINFSNTPTKIPPVSPQVVAVSTIQESQNAPEVVSAVTPAENPLAQ